MPRRAVDILMASRAESGVSLNYRIGQCGSDSLHDDLGGALTQRGKDSTGMQPANAQLPEEVVPVHVPGLYLRGGIRWRMTTPGDTSMVTKQEVIKLAGRGSARVVR